MLTHKSVAYIKWMTDDIVNTTSLTYKYFTVGKMQLKTVEEIGRSQRHHIYGCENLKRVYSY